jgi:glycine cleavage system T protein (aminomethyltransferase)
MDGRYVAGAWMRRSDECPGMDGNCTKDQSAGASKDIILRSGGLGKQTMGQRTPLYQQHVDAGARIVDFGGWDMPLHYGSQLDEHHSVRSKAGVFDVSHMTVVDLEGKDARAFLRYLLANDVARLQERGKALYSCMLNHRGGVVDDLIVYFLDDHRYRLIVNAGTREKDLQWMAAQAGQYELNISERDGVAMLAVQGPDARRLAAAMLPAGMRDAALALKPFFGIESGDWFVARTGYTGEDGWEIVVPSDAVAALWNDCIAAGIEPCGLGARDTLRLEAGMNLYGTDMDDETSPLEAGLGWTIAWEPADRDFAGRAALEEVRANTDRRKFTGLLLESKGILRNHQRVIVDGLPDGEITSGGFSPTMQRSIAMARMPAGDYSRAQVDVRGRLLDVRIVKIPFVRNGQVLTEL